MSEAYDPVGLKLGALFAERFLVRRLLGAGGMGAVYEVEQTSLGVSRALKVMIPDLGRDPKLTRRFHQEARIGASLKSRHATEVFEVGVDRRTGCPWMLSEMLTGEDLARRIKRHERMATLEVAEVFDALGQVLGEAHRQNIVHADLKPENIFLARPRDLDSVQTVKVLDFGIARIVQQSSTSYLNHGILGSPRWMAPEQLQEGGRITPATDVWALGMLAFHLFTGRHYWPHANRERAPVVSVLVQVVGEPIVPASRRAAQYGVEERVPRGFDAWFGRCVNRDDRARFQDAAEAAEALMEVLSGDASLVTTVPERRKQPEGTRPLDPREGELARALLAFTLAEQQGDLDRALTFGEKALALAPDHDELRRRLATVRAARGGR